jgi:Ribbon-helix-helix protein, copG family
MAAVVKTTVYVDSAIYRRVKAMAARQQRPPAGLVRDALREYVERHAPRPRAQSVGAGRSGRRDLSERVDELLGGLGEPR